MSRLLDNFIVLDLANEQGSFCAKLLADLGATVIKVENPDGDRSRSCNPNSFYYNNTNKLSVIVDLSARTGLQSLRALVKQADALIETFPPDSPLSIDLSPQRLHRLNPRLIHLSITSFGRTGPHLAGVRQTLPDLLGCQPYYIASLFSAVAVLIRSRKRNITGKGCYLDVSIYEAVASMLEHELGISEEHPTLTSAEDFSILRARDGYVQIPILRNWQTLCELMASDGCPIKLSDGDWRDSNDREQNFAKTLIQVEKWTGRRTRREILEMGQTMGFPWASVDSMEDVLENPQLKERHFYFHTPTSEDTPEVAFPGIPFQLGGLPASSPRPAPPLGEHTRIVFGEFGTSSLKKESPGSAKMCCDDEQIFKGVRVIDLTRMISGPYATRIFADFGAEVIKVQSRQTARGAEQNDTPFFSIWNRNKRSICLDLNTAAGRDSFLGLVAGSDVVVENFSPRVMANWGLEYDRLREVKHDLVMVSISAMGQRGPWKNFIGFAPTFHALSGLIASASGDLDPPTDLGYPYADIVAGLYAALAAFAVLEYRDRTGKGQYIDLSALEAICTFDSRFSARRGFQSSLFALKTDPLLIARRFFVQLNHPVLGKALSARTPLWDWRRKPHWKASPLLEVK